MEMERIELALETQAGVRTDPSGGVIFDFVAVDRNKTPNRKGFVFDWASPDDVMIKNWLANPVLLYRHDDDAMPVGWAERVEVTSKVVKGTARLPNLSADPDMAAYDADVLAPIRGAVRSGLLKAVSIGFYILDSEEVQAEGEQQPIIRIRKFEIVELSLCSLGAHETALIKSQDADAQAAQDVVAGYWKRGRMEPEATRKRGGRLYRLSLDAAIEPQAEPDEQPYPNEHACEIGTADYKRYRRVNGEREHDGKPIDVVYGVRASDGKSEVSSLRYKLADDWTAAAARAHCKGEDGGKFVPATEQVTPAPETQADAWVAIPYSRHGDIAKADEGADWDAGAQVAAADVEDLKVMCLLENKGALDVKAGYKLPHHAASGHKVVWRGVAAAMGVLLGARGGVKGASQAEKEKAHKHLRTHYGQYDKEPPELKAYADEELKALHAAGLIVVPGDATEAQRGPTIEERLSALEDKVDSLLTMVAERRPESAPGTPAAIVPQAVPAALDQAALRQIVCGIVNAPAFVELRRSMVENTVKLIKEGNASESRHYR